MNKRFYRLLSSSFLASMGDKFFSISLSWWILNESGVVNSGFVLGLVMAITGVCTLLFVPLLGSLADIYDRKRCMLFSMTGSMVSLVALIATYQWLQSAPALIYTVSVILGVLTAFFMSSVQSSVSFLVERDKIPQAVSMVVMATPASQVIGASIAGFAIAAFGIRGSVSCDLLLYIAGFSLLVTVPSFTPKVAAGAGNTAAEAATGAQGGSPEATEAGNTAAGATVKARDGSSGAAVENKKPSYKEVLKGGLKYLTGEKALFQSLLFFACINLFFSPILIVMPMMATTYFAGNSVALAMMEGCYSGGLIAMSIFLNRNRRAFNRHRFIFRAILIMGACFVVMGAVHIAYLVYVMLFICGAMLSLANVSLGSIYQMYVPDNMKGRFFSLMQVTVRAASPIGFAMVGLCSDLIGVRGIVLINGAVIFALSFVWLVLKKLNFNYTF